ncbi:hypothetical protein JCM10207_006000 [Rhodosporidiobolus poonsookiae]
MDPIEAFRGPQVDTAPPPPPAVVRAYQPSKDLSFTRYLVGSSVMEPSSLANQRALFTLPSILAWLAASHFLLAYFNSYPALIHNLIYPSSPKATNPDAPILQTFTDFFTLIPILIGPLIAVLAVFEMRHRYLFEGEMRRAIGEEDMRDIKGYYGVEDVDSSSSSDVEDKGAATKKKQVKKATSSGQPAQRSGFWVLEYDNRLIGAIGLDGNKPGHKLDSAVDHLDELAKKKKKEDALSPSAGSDAAAAAASAESSTTATSGAGSDRVLRSRTGKPNPALSVTPPTPASGVASAPFTLPASPLPEGTLHLRRFATSLSFRDAGIEDDLLSFAAARAFSPSSSADAEDEAQPAQQLVTTLRPAVQSALKRRLEKNGWELVPRGSELEVAALKLPREKVDAVWPVSLEVRTMVLRRAGWERRQEEQAQEAEQ